MLSPTVQASEAEILGRLIEPERGGFPPEAAKAILKIGFDARDKERMHRLSEKAREGTLTDQEQDEIEGYRRVGYLLGMLWSKARISLKDAGMDAANGKNP